MQYDLTITEHNTQAHLDIEKDIEKQKNGLFTFTLRINSGNIVDYSVTDYADARKYLILTKVVIEEHLIPHHIVVGSEPTPIRDTHSERGA